LCIEKSLGDQLFVRLHDRAARDIERAGQLTSRRQKIARFQVAGMYRLAQSVRQLTAKMPAATVQAANGRQLNSLGTSWHTILAY
jgi:hypothetical protein